MCFQLVIMSMVDQMIGTVAEVIVAGAVAATALVLLDLGQIIALQLVLGTERLTRSTLGWIGRTGRAQLLWGLAAVITIEIMPPWFLCRWPLFRSIPRNSRGFVAEPARAASDVVEVGHEWADLRSERGVRKGPAGGRGLDADNSS